MPSSDRQGPWPGSDQAYHHIPQKTPTFVVWVLATPGVDPLPEHPATDPFAQVGPSNEIRAYLSTTQSVSESLGHRTRRPSWSTTNLGTGPASSGVVHSRRKVMPHDKFVMAWVRHSPTRHFYISRLRLSCAQVSIAGGVVITATGIGVGRPAATRPSLPPWPEINRDAIPRTLGALWWTRSAIQAFE